MINILEKYKKLINKLTKYNNKNKKEYNNHYITTKYCEDITLKWFTNKHNKHYEIKQLNKTFNYNGKKYIIDEHNVKYEFRKGEKEFAEWLKNNSNKKIILLPKINKPENIKTPDYLINNEYFDYKNTIGKSPQLIYHNIRGKEFQSKNFIIEINNKNIKIKDIYNQIDYTFRKLVWVNKIAIKKNNKFMIFQRKKEVTRGE